MGGLCDCGDCVHCYCFDHSKCSYIKGGPRQSIGFVAKRIESLIHCPPSPAFAHLIKSFASSFINSDRSVSRDSRDRAIHHSDFRLLTGSVVAALIACAIVVASAMTRAMAADRAMIHH